MLHVFLNHAPPHLIFQTESLMSLEHINLASVAGKLASGIPLSLLNRQYWGYRCKLLYQVIFTLVPGFSMGAGDSNLSSHT